MKLASSLFWTSMLSLATGFVVYLLVTNKLSFRYDVFAWAFHLIFIFTIVRLLYLIAKTVRRFYLFIASIVSLPLMISSTGIHHYLKGFPMHIGTKSLDKIYFKNTELEVDAQDRIEVFGFDYGLFNHSKESQKVELYFGFIEIRKFVSQQDVQELKEVKVLNPNSEV